MLMVLRDLNDMARLNQIVGDKDHTRIQQQTLKTASIFSVSSIAREVLT